MENDDVTYRHGAWRLSLADQKIFDSNRFVLSLIEKLKRDIENIDPSDKKAQEMINTLLYHYCWKIKDDE